MKYLDTLANIKRNTQNRKQNNCNECPYYHHDTDYWGETNEWCRVYDMYHQIQECSQSMFILKIKYGVRKIKESFYNWRYYREQKKQAKFEYKERISLGMTKDEYIKWQYDEMEKSTHIIP